MGKISLRRNWDLLVKNPASDDSSVDIYECKNCGSKFGRKKHYPNGKIITGRKAARACSVECEVVLHRLQRDTYYDVKKTCVICGSEFLTTKWKASHQRYCSNECRKKCLATHGGSARFPCSVCGKFVVRRRSAIVKTVYCGYECMSEARALRVPGTNKWENVRKWFSRRGRMSKCEKCDYSEVPGILIVHHKDRNRTNNQLSNLAVLCPNCHAIEHLEENKNKWLGHISANPVKIKLRIATEEKRRAIASD